MHPFSMYPSSILDNDFHDLLLLSVLAAVEEEEEYEEDSGEDEEEDDLDDDDDDAEDDESEDEDSDDADSQDEETNEDEPVPAKRRHLNSVAPQGVEAGTSSGGSSIQILRQLRFQNSSQPGPSQRPRLPIVPVRRIPQPVAFARSVQQQPSQQNSSSPQRSNSATAEHQNSHSRSQQVQTDSQENAPVRPIISRQLIQHNLPQARVVLRLSDDIGDIYKREE